MPMFEWAIVRLELRPYNIIAVPPSLPGRTCPVRGTLSTCCSPARTTQARNVPSPVPLADPLSAARRPRQSIRVISRHVHLVNLESSLPGACQQSPRTRLSPWAHHTSILRTLPPHLESADDRGMSEGNVRVRNPTSSPISLRPSCRMIQCCGTSTSGPSLSRSLRPFMPRMV